LPGGIAVIINESISIDASEQFFFTVHYIELDDGIDMGGRLCFERMSIYTIIELLNAYLALNAFPEITCQCGQDKFRFYESGSDQQSFINLINKRPDGLPKSGLSGLMLTRKAARRLLSELVNNSNIWINYPRYYNCSICSQLDDYHRGDQKIGKEAEDTFLPPCAAKLKTIITDGSRREMRQCPECGTSYIYETEYEFLIGGSEDTQKLTRLTTEEAALYIKVTY
jgi:hypothetical protein